MRNLFFTLAFMLISSIVFADIDSNTEQIFELEITKIESSPQNLPLLAVKTYTCVSVETSCGIYGTVCSTSTEGLASSALELDDWMC